MKFGKEFGKSLNKERAVDGKKLIHSAASCKYTCSFIDNQYFIFSNVRICATMIYLGKYQGFYYSH